MIIYAYALTNYPTLIKVGQTRRSAEKRIKEQTKILPVINGVAPYKLLYKVNDKTLGVNISDYEIHKALKKYHVSGEWFNCSIEILDKTIKRIARKKIKQGHVYTEDRPTKREKKTRKKTIIINGQKYKYRFVTDLCEQLNMSRSVVASRMSRKKLTLEQAILYKGRGKGA